MARWTFDSTLDNDYDHASSWQGLLVDLTNPVDDVVGGGTGGADYVDLVYEEELDEGLPWVVQHNPLATFIGGPLQIGQSGTLDP